jgi:predicted hydrocarbon binding protein
VGISELTFSILRKDGEMAELKGKFIQLACNFLSSSPVTQQAAMRAVQIKAGMSHEELNPEEFYPTSILDAVFKEIDNNESEMMAQVRKKVIGQEVYSTIKFTVGIPEHIKTPLDHVKFEAEGFLLNHRGADVRPRRILKAEDHLVIIEAPAPGYDCTWIEGVFEGILRMTGHAGKVVKQTMCVKNGDDTCVYEIKW